MRDKKHAQKPADQQPDHHQHRARLMAIGAVDGGRSGHAGHRLFLEHDLERVEATFPKKNMLFYDSEHGGHST